MILHSHLVEPCKVQSNILMKCVLLANHVRNGILDWTDVNREQPRISISKI